MRSTSALHASDIDPVLLRLGEDVSALLLQVTAIRSPRTRSALVVFEDSLQDDHDVAEVILHIQRLADELGDAVPVSMRRALDEMTQRLGELPETHHAAMFRSGFLKRRGITPA